MQIISFDAYRALGVPGVQYVKPENQYQELERIRAADWLLYPEYWQVNSLHYVLRKRIFPNAASYHLGHDKIEMTRAFLAATPAHVPHTLILPSTEAAIEQALDELWFPMVAKHPRNSMGRGVFLLETARELRDYAAEQPVLYLQEQLPIRRDLRVVWLGDAVVAAYWREAAEGAFHNNVAQGGTVCFDDIPPAALELVEELARILGVNHAGFDLAEVDGHYYLLEFNTLFGNEALNARGIPLGQLVHAYLLSQDQEPDDTPPQDPGTPPLLDVG